MYSTITCPLCELNLTRYNDLDLSYALVAHAEIFHRIMIIMRVHPPFDSEMICNLIISTAMEREFILFPGK